jgi:hypothetical protein
MPTAATAAAAAIAIKQENRSSGDDKIFLKRRYLLTS